MNIYIYTYNDLYIHIHNDMYIYMLVHTYLHTHVTSNIVFDLYMCVSENRVCPPSLNLNGDNNVI